MHLHVLALAVLELSPLHVLEQMRSVRVHELPEHGLVGLVGVGVWGVGVYREGER